ncbi:MAG TPA: BT_3928 family protein [Chitinophagaceae bacterium]|nr:BT_3928 family protein [Chitinophagaceae bacterium]
MRIIVNISRIIVGVLFIFSGLIKANDPLGLSYKMQEFFEVWGIGSSLHGLMLWLSDYALTFSIITITLEVIVGVSILLGWGVRFFSWLLLLLIIFFTFLTGYAVLSGKIKTCGCFGDCIPLTAMQSFIKDIVLFVLIIIILFGTKYIKPIFKSALSFILICVSVLLLLDLQWYVLRRLPLIDCLPFKAGNNLLELRKMPDNAVSDKVDFKFIYEKNGGKKEFNKDHLPDSTWTFVKREDVIIEKGKNNEPPIKDFFLTTVSGSDSTEAILNQPGDYYLYFIKNVAKDTAHWLNDFRELNHFAKEKNRPLIVIASQVSAAQLFFNERNNFNVPILGCDATALKTAARTDPALYLMKGPIVQKKWGKAGIERATK